MSLQPGHKLAHYEILELIGRGGIGEVYRARDGKLGRDVAIKVLPDELAQDEERLRRFQREAKVLASVNHPNIAAIYGLEESAGTHYLVLELVPGETLAERIARGPIPVGQALEIAKKIAEALEEAHEQGIVHRDLKPANVKLTPDGKVKVLDFGLAKAFAEESAEGVVANSLSPTITRDATRVGVILGTAAYMSPEQARGQVVDRRTDIWSFGVVLYEMLTGRKLFSGETVSDTLAAVLKSEIAWGPLPADTPPAIQTLLRRCLERDRKRRLGWAGDAWLEIDELATVPLAPVDNGSPLLRSRVVSAAIGVAVGLGVAGWLLRNENAAGPRPPRKLVIHKEGRTLRDTQAISPDGTMIAYVANRRLWIRRLDRIEPTEVPGSDGAELPFWSPGSDFVGFSAKGSVWKVAVDGGTPLRLCELTPAIFTGGTWSTSGDIVLGLRYSGTSGELYRVPASGGDLEPYATAEPDKGLLAFMRPQFLPDGRGLLAIVGGGGVAGAMVMLRTESGWRSIVTGVSATTRFSSAPVYSPSGHVLYVRDEGGRPQLFAVPFSLESLTADGDPFLVAENVHNPTISVNGDLVYSAVVPDPNDLAWVDRDGAVDSVITESVDFLHSPALSPDGSRLFFVAGYIESGRILDLGRGGQVLIPGGMGAWTPSNNTIVFSRGGDLLSMPSDGSQEPEPIIAGPLVEYAPDISHDGKYITYYAVDPETGRDLWYRPLDGEGEAVPFLATPAQEVLPRFSPDGKFIVYQSNTSGDWEIYVRPFPDGRGRFQVSVGGGAHPRWSGDGDEIFYVANNALMAVPVKTEPTFVPGVPKELFRGDDLHTDLLAMVNRNMTLYDVSRDGERFVVVRGAGQGTSEVVLVENGFEELKRLAPAQ